MDKCLTIVLCLSFLLFSEQHPATTRAPESQCLSLGLEYLRKHVTCNSSLTFASPLYEKRCMAAAERTFKEGLRRAINLCTDDQERLLDTLRALKRCKIQDQNSVECALEQKTFPEFVDAFENFTLYNNTLNNEDRLLRQS